METNNQNQQNVVGFAQYESLRIEYEDRMEVMRAAQQDLVSDLQKQYADDKDKSVKGWKTALMAVCIVFMMFLVGVFGSLYYVFTNYSFDMMGYTQYVETGNANLIGNDGDITNGETIFPDIKD